jgi:hypothetical protein
MQIIDQALADDLLRMAAVDQAMRMNVINDNAQWDSSIDETNQRRLMQIVDSEGWPAIAKVGAEASHAAWLLVQHAANLTFMERCLELMQALPAGEVKPVNIAYLQDRVLMMKGEPQVYGTQFQGIGEAMRVYPIQDMEHVDERRARVGLDTFAAYQAQLRELYG